MATRAHWRAAAALLSIGLTLGSTAVAGAAPTPAPPASLRPVVLDSGHIDLFEITHDEGAGGLVVQVKDDTELYDLAVAFRDPAQVTIAVDTARAGFDIPEGLPPEYQFLGDAGDHLYLLDETQTDGLPWPGWSTERLPATLPAGVELAYEPVIHLAVDVSGPGEVFTFVNDVGDDGELRGRWIDTADPGPDAIEIHPSIHAHTAWVFTEPGDYFLDVTPSAVTTTGATLTGPPVSYHFHVGPEPVPTAEAPNLVIEGIPTPSVAPGTPVTLTVDQDPVTSDGTYRWYRWNGHDEQLVADDTDTITVTPIESEYYYPVLVDGAGRIVSRTHTFVEVDPPGPRPESQELLVGLDGNEGALLISVDPSDRDVVLPPFALASNGARWETAGELRPTTVTDTRAAEAGWAASARVSDFDSAGGTLTGDHLGWAPRVRQRGPNVDATPGPDVDGVLDGGPGLGQPATLASAPAGASRGTTSLGADLRLDAPTTIEAGTYTTLLTLTVI